MFLEEFRVEFVGIIEKIGENLESIGGVCAGAPESGSHTMEASGPFALHFGILAQVDHGAKVIL